MYLPRLISRFAGVVLLAPSASAETTSVVKLLVAPNPIVQGQNTTLTAGVNLSGDAWASGTITVIDTVTCPGEASATVATLGTITVGSATSATPAAGTLGVSSFPCVGRHSLVANYSGNSNYPAGSSQPVIVVVLAQFTPVTITLTSSLNPSTIAQNVTLSVRFNFSLAENTYPTGTVSFMDTSTGNMLGTGNVQTSGGGKEIVTTASITTSAFAVGSHTVRASYSGDNVYSPSTSDTVAQEVNAGSLGPPSISTGGVVSASEFGKFTSIAPGGWIEIYGSNLAGNVRGWTRADFQGVNAPTSLDQTSVTIGGQPAFISYVSPGQVNVQVPSNVAAGQQQVIVSTSAGPSAPYTVNVNQTQPGLFGPASFDAGGKQYVGALFPDGFTFVLPPGAVSGVNARRAKPGDTITLYGTGFGAVIPNTPAGQIVQDKNTLAASIQFLFGDAPADASYSGLAPQFVGLYQFNVVVPNVAAGDAIPLRFTLGGISGTQTMYIAVGN